MKSMCGAAGNKVLVLKKLPLAVALALAGINAHAATISGGETISSDDAAGLVADPMGFGGPIAITLDSAAEGDGLSLGAGPSLGGAPAIYVDGFGPSYDLTVNVQSSGATNGVIFAGDVVTNASIPTDSITINALNDSLTFQGNVSAAPFSFQPIDINLGNGGTSTLSMTVDTVHAENLLIDATIDAAAAGDTISLNVANSQGGANGVGFGRAIGSDVALDAINIGDLTNVTFASTVNVGSGDITLNGTSAAGFADDVTGNLVFAAGNDAQALFGPNAGLTGSISTGTSGSGDVFFDPAFSNTTLVSGTVGSSSNELNTVNVATAMSAGVVSTFAGRVDAQTINIVGGPGSVTFGDLVDATTINVGGLGTTNFQGNVTGDVAFSPGNAAKVNVSADKSITGDVTTATAGSGTLNFAAPTADTTLVSGSIGSGAALSAVNIATDASSVSSLGGAVRALNVGVSGTGTAEFTGNLTGDLRFTGDALASIAADKKIVGSVSTSTDGQGALDFGQTTTDTTLVSGNVGSASAALKTIDVDIDGAVKASFAGDVFAKTINVDGNSGGELTFAGDVVTTSLNLVNDPAVRLAGSNSFSGDIATAVDNTGELLVTGGSSASFSGDIGSLSGNSLKSVVVGSGSTLDQWDFAGDLSAYDVLINDKATFISRNATTVRAKNGFVNKGWLQLGDTLSLTGGGIAELGGSSLAGVRLLSSSYSGNIVINAAGMSSVNTTNTISVIPDAAFTTGSLVLVDTDNGAGNADRASQYTVADTVSTDYSVLVDDNADVILSATPRSGTTNNADLLAVFGNQVVRNFGSNQGLTNSASNLISSLNANGNPTKLQPTVQPPGKSRRFSDGSIAETSSDTDGSYEGLGNLGRKIGDDVDGVITEGEWLEAQKDVKNKKDDNEGREVTEGEKRLIQKYRDNLEERAKSGKGWLAPKKTGGNGGDFILAESDVRFWGALSHSDADNDSGNDSDYSADVQNMTLGLSKDFSQTYGLMSLGVGFSYDRSSTDYDSSPDGSDTDTYILAVSGSHNISDKFYQIVDWSLGGGRARTELDRLASNGLTARSDFDSDLLFGEVSYSVPLSLSSLYMVPKASLAWTNIDSDGYTESGAGSDNLKMGSSRTDIFTAKLGSEFSRPVLLEVGVITPSFSVRADYDLKNDAPKVEGGLANSASVIVGKGDSPERLGLDFGVGLVYASYDQAHTLSVGYSTYLKEDYQNNSASLTYAYKF